jgi:hypothetical protein
VQGVRVADEDVVQVARRHARGERISTGTVVGERQRRS